MREIMVTGVFRAWVDALRDPQGRARVLARLDRLRFGNPGDAKPVGQGISESRIHSGPGYRIYFMERGRFVVVVLCGGDKSSRRRDIATAKRIAAGLRD
jgi:putative addiction module killer protein